MGHRVGIVGFRGYSGEDLIRLLSPRPEMELFLMEHRADSQDRARPRGYTGPARIPCTAEALRASGIDVVFLATPADVSMDLTPWILEAGAKVIDLSGAFRLGTAENYRRWYKEEHTQAALLQQAVYGLPEFHREKIRAARLLSNPGCYPTAANLAIAPLVEAGIVDRGAGVVCDAKSGVSGAGRKPSLKTSYCEVTENFSAYSLLDHRHVPEVLRNSGLDEAEFSFTAHLLPLDRGILETIYFRTLNISSADEIVAIYEKRYAGEPFVRIYNPGQVPDLRAIQRTNFCDIGVQWNEGRAVVVSAIDNLVKGAAGQAIQNMNLMLGLPEEAGLL
ncbi:MAG: N-acetyl-gamma-glutamyl-phosphate reductase [Candidatus Solibacter usitatus]|nr:N-acetyl-gamma-glutamyl-phosphate reductase [Candidatus Solibacter usitatus]